MVWLRIANEQELVDSVSEDEEMLLIEQIQLFAIRERRILKAINKYRRTDDETAVSDLTVTEDKRHFKNEQEEAEYESVIEAKVDAGERLPGKGYNESEHRMNKDLIIARLEQELSTVQSKKTKAIEALFKIRSERKKMESEGSGNSVVDDWIAAVTGGGSDG